MQTPKAFPPRICVRLSQTANSSAKHTSARTRTGLRGARAWLPLVGESFAERLALFRKNAQDLKADFFLANDDTEFSKLLIQLRDTEGWTSIGSHLGPLTDKACALLALPVLRADQAYNVADLERVFKETSETLPLYVFAGPTDLSRVLRRPRPTAVPATP